MHSKALVRLGRAPLAVAYWTGLGGKRLRASMSPRILMWHGISPRMAARFERELRFLRRNFDVIPLGRLIDALGDAPAATAGKVVLTFDDGLRNNVTIAYPLLKRLGLPATFYVCPQLAETGEWLWNHEVRQRLKRLEEPAFLRLATALGRTGADREALIAWMKTLPLAERRRAEAQARAATPRFVATAEEHDELDIAGWKDLHSLDPKIITIGSHTLSHPILPSLPPDDLELEVGGSRRQLEERLQRRVDLFAYPNGDQNAAVRACTRRHYRSAVISLASEVKSGCDLHLVPREATPPGALRLAWSMHRLPS
jgi:peptidoglycan/xylan/chitin deacetylase (PgdA/CDA1 family)